MKIEALVKDLFSEDREIRSVASARLVKLQDERVIVQLLPFLDSDDSWIRNAVSIVLHDYSNSEIVKPLLRSILKKENRGANGTMVWALGNKDVSLDVLDLFKILISHEYEAQIMVLPVIKEGDFTIDDGLRKRITDYIEEHKNTVDRRAVNSARRLLNEKSA